MPDLTEAPQLGNPLDLPDPTPPGTCPVCVALGEQRTAARHIGDMTEVSDCNVEIRRHPHRARS